jgi:hypothetical protein
MAAQLAPNVIEHLPDIGAVRDENAEIRTFSELIIG